MARPMKTLLAVLCGMVLLAACGSNGDSTSTSTNEMGSMPMSHDMGAMSTPMTSAAASASDIVISGNKFTVPASVTPGQKIMIHNKDSVEHSVTADSGGAFNVEVEPGQTATLVVPTAAGAYAFHCTYHPNMTATLTVK